MPIWLRKFTWSEIDKYYKEEAESIENAKTGGKGNKTLVSPNGKVNTPAFSQESKSFKGKTSYK